MPKTNSQKMFAALYQSQKLYDKLDLDRDSRIKHDESSLYNSQEKTEPDEFPFDVNSFTSHYCFF